jgi:uncharacterized RDD family membrane protein YckC
VTSATPVPLVPPGEPAGFGRRLLAILIDWFAALGVVLVVLGPDRYLSTSFRLIHFAVFAGEIIIFTWLISASFGQRLMRIVVVRLDGSPLGLWRAAVRTALICLVIPAVVYDSDGRGLQDRAVGSIVIRRPQARPAA